MTRAEVRAALAEPPSAYVRCLCEHPGDTPSCPIDHDQIQHEHTGTITEIPACPDEAEDTDDPRRYR